MAWINQALTRASRLSWSQVNTGVCWAPCGSSSAKKASVCQLRMLPRRRVRKRWASPGRRAQGRAREFMGCGGDGEWACGAWWEFGELLHLEVVAANFRPRDAASQVLGTRAMMLFGRLCCLVMIFTRACWAMLYTPLLADVERTLFINSAPCPYPA
jgi:hypothetical protein